MWPHPRHRWHLVNKILFQMWQNKYPILLYLISPDFLPFKGQWLQPRASHLACWFPGLLPSWTLENLIKSWMDVFFLGKTSSTIRIILYSKNLMEYVYVSVQFPCCCLYQCGWAFRNLFLRLNALLRSYAFLSIFFEGACFPLGTPLLSPGPFLFHILKEGLKVLQAILYGPVDILLDIVRLDYIVNLLFDPLSAHSFKQ